MKNIYLFFLLSLLTSGAIHGQNDSLDCENMCVTLIVMSSELGHMDVTIQNGDTQINYPTVQVIIDGDTVGNPEGSFDFFAQLEDQELTYTIPTTLTSIPDNFTCTVLISDQIWETYCELPYPCITANISRPEIAPEVHVFPNPVLSSLNISASEMISSVTITSITGQVIATHNIQRSLATISTDELPAGTYFLDIWSGSGSAVKRFVKL